MKSSVTILMEELKASHVAHYRESRDWLKDVSAIVRISPYTVNAWLQGDKIPNAAQTTLLRQLFMAMQNNRPMRQFPEQDAGRVSEMRDCGIKFVSVLGCNNPGDDCEACLALKGQKLEIEFAPDIPLAGCDLPVCKCILLAES